MNIINENCIALLEEADTAEEGIVIAGEVLKSQGYIKQSYIDAMLKNFETSGPYFAIAPGFAMPHARPEDGVIKSGIGLITLKSPVSFGSANDPIRIIMTLATSSDDEHLQFMSKIAMLLGQKQMIEKLYECRTAEEAALLLNNNQEKEN
jgi:PTS system mannitol-specific IIA component/PTS system ascorbate-specific IIA component